MTGFNSKVQHLWTNPKCIDLCSPFLYRIFIITHDGKEYRYVGQTKSGEGLTRLDRYRGNVWRILLQEPETVEWQKISGGSSCTLQSTRKPLGHHYFPFKTCPERDLKDLERQYMKEWKCNLNYHCNHKARGWALKELLEDCLTIEKLVPDELTLPL